jgi:hypothetical protein
MRKSGARGLAFVCGMVVALSLFCAPIAGAQGDEPQPRMDIYGAVMLDMGYQTGQNHPDWFDVVRPTKLPAYEDEFGKDGRWFSGVRQSRLGFKSYLPTDLGELKTTFEFELFGVGVDAGQTTFRLRHAYGELGHFGAGQTWSPFMDIDVFPNSLEYWGPNGMAFFRNVQVRWMPLQGDSRATIALERPGASGDQGNYAGAEALADVKGRLPLPDLSAEYRLGRSWGYVELAGIARYIKWDDLDLEDGTDLSGDAVGWGFNLSSNIKTGERGTLRLQALYGEGVENYMNDATADVGVIANPGDPTQPFLGEALPVLGLVAFYDINWNSKWSSSLGWSMLNIDNNEGMRDDAFHRGDYALVNLLHYPAKNFMVGIEGQYGRRENFRDGWNVDDFRVQFSAKYNFSYKLGG